MRYRIDLSYNGAGFCGWQVQPDCPSVQGTLEHALDVLLKRNGGSGETVTVTGAGRTDTGVHASAYVAHFDHDGTIDCKDLCYKLNAILPDGIAIRSVCPVPENFHARFDARRREYTYFLHRAKDPFLGGTSYYYGYPSVDFDAMNRAAEALLGTHDFSCFEKSGGDNKTSICTVFEAGWHEYVPTHVNASVAQNSGQYRYFRIAADRFLRNMVRAIVGTLLEVGRGKRTPEEFAALVLDAGEEEAGGRKSLRPNSGESAPAHALFLSSVEY